MNILMLVRNCFAWKGLARLISCWGLLYVLGYLVIRLNCSDGPVPNSLRLPESLCRFALPDRAVVYSYMPMFRIETALTGKMFTRVAWGYDAEMVVGSWVPPWWKLYHR